MPFFYRSHIGQYEQSIKNMVQLAVPTQLKDRTKIFNRFINIVKKKIQVIGEMRNQSCKKRVSSSIFFSGSLTVEAALVLPVFLGAMMVLASLFQVMAVYEQVNTHLCMTGRKLAAYSEAYDGATVVELYQLFYEDALDEHINYESISGGRHAILLSLSEKDGSGLLRLSAIYRIKIPIYFMEDRNVKVSDVVYVKAWTGANGLGGQDEKEKQSDKVYVALNGHVYHTTENCTYLDLSIHRHRLADVEYMRNRYGSKYIPCERCGFGTDSSSVYITDTGRAWHSNQQCSGLKRTLYTLTEEEAHGRGLHECSRCGK